jgi:hypothetical protein
MNIPGSGAPSTTNGMPTTKIEAIADVEEKGKRILGCDRIVTVPIGAIVLEGHLSYANISDVVVLNNESRGSVVTGHGGGNEYCNPRAAHDGHAVVGEDQHDHHSHEQGHDEHDDSLSIETVSSQSVDVARIFSKRERHEHTKPCPVKNVSEALSNGDDNDDDVEVTSVVDDDDDDDDDDATNLSLRSSSLPQDELSLRVSQVTAVSQLIEVGCSCSRWEYDVDSAPGDNFDDLKQFEASVEYHVEYSFRHEHSKNNIPNNSIATCGNADHSSCDSHHDSTNHQISKKGTTTVLMNEVAITTATITTTHNFQEYHYDQVPCKQEREQYCHSLKALETIGSGMEGGSSEEECERIPLNASTNGIFPTSILKKLSVLLVISIVGKFVLPLRQQVNVVTSSKLVDYYITSTPTTTNNNDNQTTATSEMPLAVLVKNQGFFIPSVEPIADPQDAAFQWSRYYLSIVSLACVVVIRLRAVSSSYHMISTVCYNQGKEAEEIFKGGTRHDPQDSSPGGGVSTNWRPPLKKNENDLTLYAYRSMKVVELRRLLRTRGCKTEGTKEVLINRFVAIYQAELATLTVQQLRRKLRSRGCLQGGIKRELIGRLIEAGL